MTIPPPLPLRLRALADIHTHNKDNALGSDNAPQALVSLRPEEAAAFTAAHPDALFSAGIHPWEPYASQVDEDRRFAALENALTMKNAAAVGETGLDSLRGPEPRLQEERFRRHVALSESMRLPLVIHMVKTQESILALRKELRPSQPWIIHGFRGKAAQALQLASAGLYVSFGERFNPEALAAVPALQRLAETDESALPIAEIIARQREFTETRPQSEDSDHGRGRR